MRLTGVTRAFALLAIAPALAAQVPRIGDIDVYGLRKLTSSSILEAMRLESGDRLPASKGDLEDAISKVPGVVLARVEAVCCEGQTVTLFIGIEERGGPHFNVRMPPAGNAVLPASLVSSYHEFLRAVERAAAQGEVAEDLSAGQSMFADPQARSYQDSFASFAAAHLAQLRDVLRNAPAADDRAVAAAVIGYAPHKRDVINDLQYAIQDPDEAVRANAMHALAAIGVLGGKQPALGIRISPTWFVEVLHSVVLSDRMEAIRALTILTDRDNPETLDLMRTRALPDLVEMARWKTLRYALPPFVLVGRIAGLTDARIQELWSSGDRETAIRKALATVPSSGRR